MERQARVTDWNEDSFDTAPLRAQFPALEVSAEGRRQIFFDSPGGTQVPERVIEAVANYYRERNANTGGAFATSRRTDETLAGGRAAMAAMLNAASPDEIVFGANMTTLTFHLARSVADSLRPGDEIVVTNLDHDANVTPWTELESAGAVIRSVDFRPEDCHLPLEAFAEALSPRTRLVAVTHASNAVGTVPDVASVVRLAHAHNALVYVDAVQYAPHGPIDVQALDCDFLVCSAYKFFGPHLGVLYGKAQHLRELVPHKVRPASNALPNRWETGTQNHEGIAGAEAAVDYLADIGVRFGALYQSATAGYTGRRQTLKAAMHAIRSYEQKLTRALLAGLGRFPDIRIYGPADPNSVEDRLPTIAFTWPRLSPAATAASLAESGICCWSGNYYALRLMERLGLEQRGGAVRIGLTHCNTPEELETLFQALDRIPARRAE